MAEGNFYSGGAKRFNREGESLQERNIQFPSRIFEEDLEQLRAGDAVEIARKYRFGRAVTEYLKTHPIEELDQDGCIEFLLENPEFNGHRPALVRAVAEEIEVDRVAQEKIENTKH